MNGSLLSRNDWWCPGTKIVDVNLNVRLRNGVRLQGGTSTGRRITDDCEILPDSPSRRFCRVVEPFNTQVRGLGSYTIPTIVLVSGTFQSNPRQPDRLPRGQSPPVPRNTRDGLARPVQRAQREPDPWPDQTYGSAWLNPTSVMDARFIRLSTQIDF